MKNLITLIFTIAFVATVSAQTPVKKGSPLDIAKEIVDNQWNLMQHTESREKRLSVLIEVAKFYAQNNLFGSYGFLRESFELADSNYKQAKAEKLQSKTEEVIIKDRRDEVIDLIANYFPDSAKDFNDQVLNDFEAINKSLRNENEIDFAVENILDFAYREYGKNPQFALSQMRRAMKYQLNRRWVFALTDLAEKNQSEADILYSELLVRHADSPISDLVWLSGYPFGKSRINSLTFGSSHFIPKNFVPNPTLQHRFIELILQRSDSRNNKKNAQESKDSYQPAAYLYQMLRDFEPIVKEKFSDLSDRRAISEKQILKLITGKNLQAIAQDEKKIRVADKNSGNKIQPTSAFEKQFESVKKADAAGKLTDKDINSLLKTLSNEEYFVKAEPFLKKVKSLKLRENLSLYFYFWRTNNAINQKRFADARSFTSKIEKTNIRISLLLKLAEYQTRTKTEKAETVKFLEEIYGLILPIDNKPLKANFLLRLTESYSIIDTQRMLNSLSESIKTTNESEKPDTLFSTDMKVDIEGSKFTMREIEYGINSYNFRFGFKKITNNDFNETLNAVSQYSDSYLRSLAIIAVAGKWRDCEEVTNP
jgi:hypothetical protein